MKVHTEAAFETVLVESLITGGYKVVAGDSFDRERAIFPEVVIAFIEATQPKQWEKLQALHGASTGERILHDLCKWMDTHGSLATLGLQETTGSGCDKSRGRVGPAAHDISTKLPKSDSRTHGRKGEVSYSFGCDGGCHEWHCRVAVGAQIGVG
ncbi:MAG: hypothetical protein WD049_01320, partial [Candidatus Paceibacterota bacterium]